MNPLTCSIRLHPSTSARASISADGLVLLDVDNGLVLTSNLVGARIWELIDQQLSADELARRLVADYGIADDLARRDVASFVASLASRGLVTQAPRT